MHSLSSEQWQRIWDESEIPMAMVSGDHRFVRCNRSFCALVGYAASELTGRTWQSITHPDDVRGDEVSANDLQTNPDNTSYMLTKRYLTKVGISVFVNLHVRAVRDTQDRFVGYYVIAIPIPEHATCSREAPVVSKPSFRFTSWLAENPKDALLLLLAAGLVLGRDTLLTLLQMWFSGGGGH